MSPFVRRPAVRHADRVLARSVLALVLAVYTATFAGMPGAPAGELAFQTTRSMARGSLALGDTPEAELLVVAAESAPHGAMPVRPGAGARADQRYTCFGLGHSALGLPLYVSGWAVGRVLPHLERQHVEMGYHGRQSSEFYAHLFVGWRNALLAAFTAWLLVLVTRRLGASRPHAWLAGLTYGLTTYAWPQSRGSLPEVSGTFLILLAFHLTLRMRERLERFQLPRWSSLVGVGSALGLAWVTSAALRPAVLVLAATVEIALAGGYRHLAASRWNPRGGRGSGGGTAVALVIAPLLAAVLIQGLVDHLRFDVWLDPCGLRGLLGPWRGSGAGELLISPGRGLIWTAPLVLLAPLGVWRSWNEGERLYPCALAALTVALLLPAMILEDPGGRWSFGPRPLLPLLPFLWVGVGLALPWIAERRGRARVAVALALFGLLVQLPATLVDEATYEDLARQAAVEAWAEDPPADETELWSRAAWDMGFAAPWVHWRILRHRVAGMGERFPVDELFRVDSAAELETGNGRARGFHHLAWVDLARRVDGSPLPGLLAVLALFVLGAFAASAGLDPGRH